MWDRIQYADWADIVPYLAFFLTFGVFLIIAVRALFMRREKAQEMAELPLQDITRTDDREPSTTRDSK